jgi:porphobilinogen synthase
MRSSIFGSGFGRTTLLGMEAFPATRLRRLRGSAPLRDLVRETTLSLDDLIQPLFVASEPLVNERLPVFSRLTVDEIVRECEELVRAGVKGVILFGIPPEKDEEGSGAWTADGIVQQALRALRPRFPELLLLTDVCLCEYTSHGHCGVLRGDEVDNDASLELLTRTAVSHVEAGADAVCPSDMMDGRIAAIRAELPETPILAYSAKYASSFYGPFRDAAGSAPSFGDRRSYQLDYGNVREALRECELDVAEGADMLMVKPALPYLDVIRAVRDRFDLPLAAYNVSGEYAMLKAGAAAGDLDERSAAIESLTAIRRAGADVIFTYWAKEYSTWIYEAPTR